MEKLAGGHIPLQVTNAIEGQAYVNGWTPAPPRRDRPQGTVQKAGFPTQKGLGGFRGLGTLLKLLHATPKC